MVSKPNTLQAVTANLLSEGTVVWLKSDGDWADRIEDAAAFEGAEADAALKRAEADYKRVVSAYLIEIDPGHGAIGQERLKETIRAHGPTVRLDLGKQAGDR